jgi:hypothetical protein
LSASKRLRTCSQVKDTWACARAYALHSIRAQHKHGSLRIHHSVFAPKLPVKGAAASSACAICGQRLISRTLLVRTNFAQTRPQFVEAGRHRHEVQSESKKAITSKTQSSIRLDSMVAPSLRSTHFSIFAHSDTTPRTPHTGSIDCICLLSGLGKSLERYQWGVFRLGVNLSIAVIRPLAPIV